MAKGYSLDALVNEHYMKSCVNLDDIKLDTLTGMDSVGVYYQSSNAYVTTANGYPAGAQAGTLEVLPHNANKLGRVMQRYTTFSSISCWVRSQRFDAGNDSFGAWVELINANNIYNAIYPIGIVLKFDNATNPNNAFTGTVWEQITDGRAVRAASSAEVGSTLGQIGALAGEDEVTIDVTNLPSHTHNMRNHTHSIASHTHTMAHTHTINHDHGATEATLNGAHVHNISGTANSAGAHSHNITVHENDGTGAAVADSAGGGTSRTVPTTSAGAHTHSLSGTAEGAGAHQHRVVIPSYTGTSGGSSAANTGGTALTTGAPSSNESGATGSGTKLNVCNASHYYALWKRVA